MVDHIWFPLLKVVRRRDPYTNILSVRRVGKIGPSTKAPRPVPGSALMRYRRVQAKRRELWSSSPRPSTVHRVVLPGKVPRPHSFAAILATDPATRRAIARTLP